MFFNIDSFELKTPYTVKFIGFSSGGRSDIPNTIIEYSGADILDVGQAIVPEKMLRHLKKEFNKIFGYGPFNGEQLKLKIKAYPQFIFNN